MPPKTITIIIVVLIVVAHVVGGLLERSTKAKQEERARQAAARRTRKGGQSAPAQSAPPLSERATELAARRRAQLEELRQRRTHRQAPGAAGQQGGIFARTGGAPTASPRPGRPTPPTMRVPPYQPTQPPRRRPAQRRLPATPTTAAGRAQVRKQAYEQDLRREAEETAATAAADAESRVAAERTARTRPDPTLREASHQLFASPTVSRVQMLRRMVVLKEILDPPVALREQHAWERV